MPVTPRRVKVIVVALWALGAFTLALTSSSAAGVCASCHVMRPYAEALQRSPHRDVSCYTCHLPSGLWDLPGFKVRELASMYPRGLASAGTSLTGPGIHVASERCVRCHPEVLAGKIENNGVRIVHETCVEEGGACDSCHTSSTHGAAARRAREYDMERCVACHDRLGATKECDACHAAKLMRQRLTASAWRVTHGPRWEKTHGLGSITYCVTCHPGGYCKRCHGVDMPHPATFANRHGAAYRGQPDSCRACHSTERFCDRCHGIRMPHPAGFLAEHPKVATDRHEARCVENCHYVNDCDACHVKHTHPGSTDGRIGRTVRVP